MGNGFYIAVIGSVHRRASDLDSTTSNNTTGHVSMSRVCEVDQTAAFVTCRTTPLPAGCSAIGDWFGQSLSTSTCVHFHCSARLHFECPRSPLQPCPQLPNHWLQPTRSPLRANQTLRQAWPLKVDCTSDTPTCQRLLTVQRLALLFVFD